VEHAQAAKNAGSVMNPHKKRRLFIVNLRIYNGAVLRSALILRQIYCEKRAIFYVFFAIFFIFYGIAILKAPG
jgi:uncharacterized membrane protein